MSYVDNTLNENETVVYRAHYHPQFILINLIGMGAALVIGVGYSAAWIRWGLCLLAVYNGIRIIQYMSTEVAITNMRLIYKRGLIARRVDEIGVDRVEGCHIYQSILGRIMNYGQVQVRGVGFGVLTLPGGIEKPIALRKAIDEARSLQR